MDDKGVNRCHLCGSPNLEPNPQAPRDPREHLVCRNCGTAVNITHWVVHRAQWWTEVTYVTQSGKPEGKVIAFAAPTRPGQPIRAVFPNFMFPVKRGRAGLTPDEIAFADFKLRYPDKGPEREGRLWITPRVIKSEEELDEVQTQIDGLIGQKRDAYEELYFDYLADLIVAWEEVHEDW